MRTLSCHLPPAPAVCKISRVKLAVIIGICGTITVVALSLEPIRPAMITFIVAVSIFSGIAVVSKLGNKKFKDLMSVREGEDICTFRRAFDLRKVDPWIVRAVHEEIQSWLGCESFEGKHSIRASDRLTEDLQIDPEDVQDMAETIATRAGYDLKDTLQNPMTGKVYTVGELVMFFTHQRKLRS